MVNDGVARGGEAFSVLPLNTSARPLIPGKKYLGAHGRPPDILRHHGQPGNIPGYWLVSSTKVPGLPAAKVSRNREGRAVRNQLSRLTHLYADEAIVRTS